MKNQKEKVHMSCPGDSNKYKCIINGLLYYTQIFSPYELQKVFQPTSTILLSAGFTQVPYQTKDTHNNSTSNRRENTYGDEFYLFQRD